MQRLTDSETQLTTYAALEHDLDTVEETIKKWDQVRTVLEMYGVSSVENQSSSISPSINSSSSCFLSTACEQPSTIMLTIDKVDGQTMQCNQYTVAPSVTCVPLEQAVNWEDNGMINIIPGIQTAEGY